MPNISLPPLHKRAGNWLLNTYETSLVTFSGLPLAITFDRGWTDSYAIGFTVRNLLTGNVIAQKAWCGGLGCAIVVNGVIHIFGSTAWGINGNRIIHSTLDANYNPSQPNDVLVADSTYRILNTDVCATPNGFALTYETTSGIYFMTSPDMVSWASVQNASIHQGQYCACPSIHYVNGAYHLTYLSHLEGKYVTQVSKSSNLINWTDFSGNTKYLSYICLIAPDGNGEGINSSDVSMTECGSFVYGVYMNGDQTTWAHLKTFVYFGSMAALFAEFFPTA